MYHTMLHMKKISIRELHQHTGDWVRRAAEESIIVTERGAPRVLLVPYEQENATPKTLRDRRIQPAFAALHGQLAPRCPDEDSTVYLETDRDRD